MGIPAGFYSISALVSWSKSYITVHGNKSSARPRLLPAMAVRRGNAAVASYLLQISPAREPSHPYGSPTQTGHHRGKAAACPGAAIALRHS